jgi:hypothetical protein
MEPSPLAIDLRAPPRGLRGVEGTHRTVGDAPAAIGTMGKHLEVLGRQLERVRRADAGAEAAENARVLVDADHEEAAPPATSPTPGGAPVMGACRARPNATKPVRAHLMRTGESGIPSMRNTSSRVI